SIDGSTMSTLHLYLTAASSRTHGSGYTGTVARKGLRCFACESPLRASYLYCPSCGVRLDSGVAAAADPSSASEPTTVYARERPRLFGVAPQDSLLLLGMTGLVLGFAAFGTGHLVAGIALLVLAYVFLGAFVEAMRRRPASTIARRTAAALRVLHRDLGFVIVTIT